MRYPLPASRRVRDYMWWRHRHEDRITEAERELEESRARLEETYEKVVKPLRKAAARNNFAEIIALTLNGGHARIEHRGNNA